MPQLLPLFRVGLLCRVRIGKSRDGHAGVIDAHDPRIRIERGAEDLGRRYLRYQADVRDGWPVVMAERAALGMFGEQRLNRLQAGAKPMLYPGEPLVIADLEHIRQIVANTRHDQRMRVGHVDQCEPAHPGPCLRICGQQRRLRVLLLEIFENSQRLEELDVTVDQGWDHHLRIDRAVRIGELIALFEVQKAVLPRDALQVERDAHAETRLRAVICVELHLSLSFSFSPIAATGTNNGGSMPEKGPPVYLDYDQAALDAAYDQAAYAPNREQLIKRRISDSKLARLRVGEPERVAYGPAEIERLDIYRSGHDAAPVFIFVH